MAEIPENLVGNELNLVESTPKGTENPPAGLGETGESSIKIAVAAEDVPRSPAADGHPNEAAAVAPGNGNPVVPWEIVPPTIHRAREMDDAGLDLDEIWVAATSINHRKAMEDFVCIKPGFIAGPCDTLGGCTAPPNEHTLHRSNANYFAVFDGHGGSEVR
ncbi:hypothetical protein NL676_026918 [Syzygium grande]|nr:hypothetical protein NL676_026918 [Syzygium grande]